MPAAVAADPPLLASPEELTRARAVVASASEHDHIGPRMRADADALLADGATLATARAVVGALLLFSPDLHTAHAELALKLIADTMSTASGFLLTREAL